MRRARYCLVPITDDSGGCLHRGRFGVSGGRVKRPETALRCPTLRPGARKRGLHRPRRISSTILGALSVVLEGLKQSHAHRLTAAEERGGFRETEHPVPYGFDIAFHKLVWGQLRVGRPQIHNQWWLSGGLPFLTTNS